MSTVDFTTDQTGANNPLDSSNNRIFNFILSSAYTVGKGSFSMKKGSSSSNGVTATIYSGLNGSGSSLTSVFVPASGFFTSFTITDFIFNYNLSSGSYSLVLTTTDGTGGSTQYSIKTDSFKTVDPNTGAVIQVFDTNGNPTTPTPTPTPTNTSTSTPTRTPTLTPTLTNTNTQTSTRTLTATLTVTSTQTSTNNFNTPTPTRTLTPTTTSTSSSTPTPTPTITSTSTNTPTLTQTVTSTSTQTPTPTPTITSTQTTTSTFYSFFGCDQITSQNGDVIISQNESPITINCEIPTPTPTLTIVPTNTPTLTRTHILIKSNKLSAHGHGKLTNRGSKNSKITKRLFRNIKYRLPGDGKEY